MNKFKKRQFLLACFFAIVITTALFTGYLSGDLFVKALIEILTATGGDIQGSI